MKKFRAGCLLSLAVLAGHLSAAPEADEPTDGPVFELDEYEVIYSATDFGPAFSVQLPRFSYYRQPDLPRGDLILALEFMDRYRESPVPGEHKWAGLLHFPVVDGYEQAHLKWICLYFYGDRMFGFDPTARFESERRFFVPIRYADREKPQVLFQFAQSYVAEMFPGGEEEIYLEEAIDPDDPSAGYDEVIEFIDVSPGRIQGFLQSESKLTPEELVRLVYRYSEDPNPRPDTPALMGRGEDFAKGEPFTWSGFWQEFGKMPDPLEIARNLVAPRWSRIAVLRYPRKILALWEIEAKERVLLFNIGMRVYAYDQRFGVWRTNASIRDILDGNPLSGKIRYPGVDAVPSVELEPVSNASN